MRILSVNGLVFECYISFVGIDRNDINVLFVRFIHRHPNIIQNGIINRNGNTCVEPDKLIFIIVSIAL